MSYSMVCDHRPQCGDGSNESFCVFPPCSDTTPMQCGTCTQEGFEGGLEREGAGGGEEKERYACIGICTCVYACAGSAFA